MEFTVTNPDGSIERRRHIPYCMHIILSEIGPIFEARRLSDGGVMARSYASEEDCRKYADSMTEKIG